jgi:hypothetical protein
MTSRVKKDSDRRFELDLSGYDVALRKCAVFVRLQRSSIMPVAILRVDGGVKPYVFAGVCRRPSAVVADC